MDWQSVQPIFTWLSEHSAWSGLFVFLIAFSESLLIVGLIVPGTLLMFGVGTLIGTGVLDIRQTLLAAFIGAVVGDGLSYWIGARYHQQLSKLWPLKNNPDYLDRGKQYFLKHGGKSVFFGRFIGPIRPFIPAVAGMMHMPGKYFFTINVISAAAWAPFYLLPGIVFGTSIGLASIVGTRLLVILSVLLVSIFLLVWLIRKVMIFISPRIEIFYMKCYRYAVKNSIFGSAVKAIIDPDTAERRGLTYFSILIILTLTVLILFAAQFSSSILMVVNETVENVVLLTRSTIGDQFMLAVREYYSWLSLILTILCCFLFLFLHRQILLAKHLILLLVLVTLSGIFLNFISEMRQATAIFVNLKILLLTSFVSFFAFFIGRQQSFIRQWVIFSLFSVLVLMFLMAELYLGMSELTEIISSISIAFIWVLLIATAYRQHTISLVKMKLTVMLVCMGGVFLLSGSYWLNKNYESDYALLTLKNEKILMSYQQWVDGTSSKFHFQRQDMFGVEKQYLNLQWLGGIETIKNSLEKLGWQLAMNADYRSILYWLKPDVSLHELPHISQTHLGEKEVLTMVMFDDANEAIKILQFWPSGVVIRESNDPVWLGSINHQAISQKAKWLAFLKVTPLSVKEMAVFERSLITQDFKVTRAKNNAIFLIRKEGLVPDPRL